MSLGFDRQLKLVSLGDTARLSTRLYDEKDQLYSFEDLAAVSFAIQKPAAIGDGTTIKGDGNSYDVNKIVIEGEILEDGTGFLNYDNADVIGHYIVVATFTLVDGTTKSTRSDFEVFDPFQVVDGPVRLVADGVWTKLEDCFDAEEEGPWLRDMTQNIFNKGKMIEFMAEGLFDINQQNPPTGITIDGFFAQNVPNSDAPLLVQATFLSVVRHLMRSYVEQPQPMGSQVVYEDRREYLQRWQEIYTIEKETYERWIALWKRKYLKLGHSKSLVATKAGRLIPASMRTRYIGRGYY